MKYVRTKDGIFRIKATPQSNAMYCGSQTYCIYDHIEMVDRDIFEKDVIKQANTIEKLCDVFVYCKGSFKIVYSPSTYSIRDLNFYDTIYGAIWTDKGLIYVAKMNERGELELL